MPVVGDLAQLETPAAGGKETTLLHPLVGKTCSMQGHSSGGCSAVILLCPYLPISQAGEWSSHLSHPQLPCLGLLKLEAEGWEGGRGHGARGAES